MARNRRRKRQKPTTILSCLTRMKSMIAPIRDSMAPVRAVYTDFCKETTLHGLKHTVEPKLHFLERVLWLALTISAFVGAVYCGLSQLSRYMQEPVVVSLQRDYRSWQTTFPAVTACFIDRINPDKAKAAIELHWNVTEESDPERFRYYSEFLDLVSDVSFRENLQNFWKYQADETVKDIDLMELALSVHPSNLLSVMLSHKKEVRWYPVMTEVGMCLTFNSQYAEYQYMLHDHDVVWKKEILLQCHYHSEQCYVRIDSKDNAIRYFIHSPYEISTAISNPTGEVAPGEELIIDFKAYSFALCQMHCRTRMAIMFCGCRPYFHVKGDGDVCDAHGMACIGRNVEILINIPKNLAKCVCPPQCAEINYYSHTKKVVVRAFSLNMNLTSSDAPSVAALRINMMPPKLRLHRDVIFTLEDLFASLGGTTALFVGASVLTVVETVLFIVRHATSAVLAKVYARSCRIQYKP